MASFSAQRFKTLAPGARLFIGEHGLFLFCTPSGVKSWRLQPRLGGKRLTLVLGRWPAMGLDQARDAARAALDQTKAGLHPRVERAASKLRNLTAPSVANLFADHVHQWGKLRSPAWNRNLTRWFGRHIAPALGALPARSVTGLHCLQVVRAAEQRGTYEGNATRALLVTLLDRAVALGELPTNPARSLRSVSAPHVKVAHRPCSLDQARALWARLDREPMTGTVRNAIKLLMLTACRASEVAYLEIAEVQPDRLSIARSRMKRKGPGGPFEVPLSVQARAVLVEQHREASARFVFPNAGTKASTMDTSSLNAAFARMGLPFPPHSLRNAFSTTAYSRELASPDTIEASLDHLRGNAVARAYNRSSLFEQRAALLQRWADLLTAR